MHSSTFIKEKMVYFLYCLFFQHAQSTLRKKYFDGLRKKEKKEVGEKSCKKVVQGQASNSLDVRQSKAQKLCV